MNGSMNVEGLSNAEGKCEYITEGSGYYSLLVSREGFVSYTKEICVSKQSSLNIAVPLIPNAGLMADRAVIRLCLSGDAGAAGLSFIIYCPNETKINPSSENGVGSLAIISSGVNEWYRVCVACSKDYTTVGKEKLDKYLRNEMQAHNIVLQVVVNDEAKYSITPPSFMAGDVWDIGFLNGFNGEIMLINSMVAAPPQTRLEFCNEYFGLYLQISKSPNLKSLLGTYLT
jgi:hypothetical protein